jgi:peptide deformylase
MHWKSQKPPFWKYKKKVFKNIIKTADFIYQIGESDALRKPSQAVTIAGITLPVFQEKIAYLKACIQKYRKLTGMGRGITGVQVGIPEKVAVILLDKKLVIIINPVITKKSVTLLRYPEICMSANPLIAPVVRPSWIEFSYYDEKGEKQCWNTKDDTKEGRIYNRVFQHEIDHMDGIINIDRVQSNKLIFESDPLFYEKAKFKKVRNKS